jgi:hypothetical protein
MRKSRYLRKEEQKSLQQTVIFGILTIGVLLAAVFLGIPLLVKAAIFLGDIKGKAEIVEKTSDALLPPPVLVQTYTATNSAEIAVSGFASEGSTVWFFLNGKKTKEVMADKNGEFSISGVVLTGGTNEIKAFVKDDKGAESKYSEIYEVVYDNEPPLLEILEPADGAEFFGEDKNVTLKGKTESDANVYINDRMAIVDPSGSFSLIFSLAEGENKIKAVARDEAGNQTETEIILNYHP